MIKILHYAGIFQRVNGKVQKVRGTVRKVRGAVQKHPAEYKKLGDLFWQYVHKRQRESRR